MPTIYEKPTRLLIRDMVKELLLERGKTFTTATAIEWFRKRYPKLKAGSIKAHLVQASTNDRNRLHHATRVDDDVLYKTGAGTFRLYVPSDDPPPIHKPVTAVPNGSNVRSTAEVEQEEEEEDEDSDEAEPGSTRFALEQDLQRYLAANLSSIEAGLTLYHDEDIRGYEYPAGGGRRIDILAVDRLGALVVIELKVEKGYDRVIGQLLRYMNWARQNLADGDQRVRGIIVCRTMSEDLRLACASIPNVELFEYHLAVTVTKIPTLALRGSA